MRMAFTLDDLPVFPHLALPDGHTPYSVAARIINSLGRNGVTGVYAFANSWPLDVDPGYARILDDWVAAGHHIGNHTHTHPLLNGTSAGDFIHDISVADDLLAPWIDTAPLRAFRHPLELWGNTEEKRVRVNAHLDRLAYRSAGVTSWFYEWEWDRAWRHLLQTGRTEEAERLKAEFVDYAAAQVAHDAETCRKVFGHEVIGIGLIHTIAFFTEVADAFFARLFAEGVAFVPLSEALDDPAYLPVRIDRHRRVSNLPDQDRRRGWPRTRCGSAEPQGPHRKGIRTGHTAATCPSRDAGSEHACRDDLILTDRGLVPLRANQERPRADRVVRCSSQTLRTAFPS